jgi:hypothetical protein
MRFLKCGSGKTLSCYLTINNNHLHYSHLFSSPISIEYRYNIKKMHFIQYFMPPHATYILVYPRRQLCQQQNRLIRSYKRTPQSGLVPTHYYPVHRFPKQSSRSNKSNGRDKNTPNVQSIRPLLVQRTYLTDDHNNILAFD